MPQCIKFLNKETKAATSLSLIDEQICALFGWEVHPRFYGGCEFNWFDTVAYMLATGMSYEEVRTHYSTSNMWTEEWSTIEKIIDFLQTNYDTNNFYAPKGELVEE